MTNIHTVSHYIAPIIHFFAIRDDVSQHDSQLVQANPEFCFGMAIYRCDTVNDKPQKTNVSNNNTSKTRENKKQTSQVSG